MGYTYTEHRKYDTCPLFVSISLVPKTLTRAAHTQNTENMTCVLCLCLFPWSPRLWHGLHIHRRQKIWHVSFVCVYFLGPQDFDMGCMYTENTKCHMCPLFVSVAFIPWALTWAVCRQNTGSKTRVNCLCVAFFPRTLMWAVSTQNTGSITHVSWLWCFCWCPGLWCG